MHDLACLERSCANCGTVKLSQLLTDVDVTQVKWKGYECAQQQGSEQKRLGLVDKTGSKSDFVEDLCSKVKPFALHRFMAYWTYTQYRELLGNLPEEDDSSSLT